MNFATASFLPWGSSGILLRHDTKLWFGEPPETKAGVCVGAVVGLNPGSSDEDRRPGFARVDPTMQAVLGAWRSAYAARNLALPENAYVRMWNLCYARDADSGRFCELASDPELLAQLTSGAALDPTEDEPVPGIWFAWTASAPFALARRSLRWLKKENGPAIVFLGPDGRPHAFESEKDFARVRHPGRKTSEQLTATVLKLLDAGR